MRNRPFKYAFERFLLRVCIVLVGAVGAPAVFSQSISNNSPTSVPSSPKKETVGSSTSPAPNQNEKQKWLIIPIHPSEILEGRGWRQFGGSLSMWIDHQRTLVQIQAPGSDALVMAPGVALENGVIELLVRPSEKESRVWVHLQNADNGDVVWVRKKEAAKPTDGDRISVGIFSKQNGQMVKGSEKASQLPSKKGNELLLIRIEILGKKLTVYADGATTPLFSLDTPNAQGKAVGLGVEAGGESAFGNIILYLPWEKGEKKMKASTPTKILSMEESIGIACGESVPIKIAELEMTKMLKQIKRVNAGYLPTFKIETISPDYRKIRLNDPDLSAANRKYDFLDATGALSMTEHLPSNTDITVRASRGSSTSTAMISERLRLQVDQEILRKDTVAKAKSIAEEQAELQKVANRSIRRGFVNQVKRSYYTYLEARTLYHNTLQRYRDDKILDTESEQKFRSGIIAEYNRLDYRRDFERSISRLTSRETSYLQARTELFFLLRRDDNSNLEFEDISEKFLDNVVLRPDRMLEAVLRHSLDLAQMNYAIFSNSINITYLRDQLLPSMKIRAGSEWNRNSHTLYDDQPSASTEYFAGLQLVLPFFGETIATDLAAQVEESDREINRLDLDERFRYYKKELQKDIVDLEDVYRRYRISKEIHAVSTKDYDLSRKRFEVGAISSWDMIRSKNDYYDSMDQEASLRFEVLRRLADIERDYPMEGIAYADN